MATIGSLVVDLYARTTEFLSGMKQAQTGVMALDGTVKAATTTMNLFNASLGTVGISLAGAFTAFKGIHAVADAESNMAQLKATLTSTGNAAGLSADQITKFAEGLAETTNFGKQATIQAAALMGTFTAIKGDVFKDAIVAAEDLNTKMGGDLQDSIVRVGKALQDPIAGVTALRRVGVAFSEDQKKQIKLFVETGDTLSAQKMILQELSREFGGSAAAAANTFNGHLIHLEHEAKALAKTLGAMLMPFVDITVQAIRWTLQFKDTLLTIVAAYALVQAALKAKIAYLLIVKALEGPSGWVAIAAAAGVATLAISEYVLMADNQVEGTKDNDAALKSYNITMAQASEMTKALAKDQKHLADEKAKLQLDIDTFGMSDSQKKVEGLKRGLVHEDDSRDKLGNLNRLKGGVFKPGTALVEENGKFYAKASIDAIKKLKDQADLLDKMKDEKNVQQELNKLRKEYADIGKKDSEKRAEALVEQMRQHHATDAQIQDALKVQDDIAQKEDDRKKAAELAKKTEADRKKLAEQGRKAFEDSLTSKEKYMQKWMDAESLRKNGAIDEITSSREKAKAFAEYRKSAMTEYHPSAYIEKGSQEDIKASRESQLDPLRQLNDTDKLILQQAQDAVGIQREMKDLLANSKIVTIGG